MDFLPSYSCMLGMCLKVDSLSNRLLRVHVKFSGKLYVILKARGFYKMLFWSRAENILENGKILSPVLWVKIKNTFDA